MNFRASQQKCFSFSPNKLKKSMAKTPNGFIKNFIHKPDPTSNWHFSKNNFTELKSTKIFPDEFSCKPTKML